MTLITGITAYKINSANDEYRQDYLALNELNLQLEKEIEVLKAGLSNYQQELDRSKVTLASLNNELNELKRALASSENTVALALQNEEIEKAEPVVAEKAPNKSPSLSIAEKIRRGESLVGSEDNFREKFYSEEVDAEWAYEYEANIRELAISDEENRFDIQELLCKTSGCEIKISANENNAGDLGLSFAKVLGKQQWTEAGSTVFFNHKVKDGAITILIGRDENSFN